MAARSSTDSPRPAVLDGFQERFGVAPRWLVRAPGRANIIGEHTDYNGGLVLPFAVAPSVYLACGPSGDERVHVHSLDFDGALDLPLPRAETPGPRVLGWGVGVYAVLNELARSGFELRGMRACVGSDVPIGAGLSSSSAFEVAVVLAARVNADLSFPDWDIVTTCQNAESHFLGVNSGVMDPFASVFGQDAHALLLDNATYEWRAVSVPADLAQEHEWLVIDSGFQRRLAATGYNQRRAECDGAVEKLRAAGASLTTLSGLEASDLDGACRELSPLEALRARHVVEENARVRSVVSALELGDAQALGRLLDRSHASLRELYEVSLPAIDELIGALQARDDVLGARIMGAGFGGSLIALVRRGAATEIRAELLPSWGARHGTRPQDMILEPAAGATVQDA